MVNLEEHREVLVGLAAAAVVFALAVVALGGADGIIVGVFGALIVLLVLGVRNMMTSGI